MCRDGRVWSRTYMLGSMCRCVIERSQLRACDIIIAISTRSEIWKLHLLWDDGSS